MSPEKKGLSIFAALAAKFGRSQSKHQVFLCGGPDCCTHEQGIASFNHMRERLKKLGLDHGPERVQCTKSGCLGVCGSGPIAVVYPHMTWYDQMTPERIDRVIEEHILKERIVKEFAFTPPPTAHPPIEEE